MDIEARVRRLERQNRWLIGGLALAALVIVGMGASRKGEPKEIRAESFEGNAFFLKTPGGKLAASLGVVADGSLQGNTALTFYDGDDDVRASLLATPRGTSTLMLRGPGKSSFTIACGKSGRPMIGAKDESGQKILLAP